MLWPEIEAPHFGTGTYAPTGEYGIFLMIKHGYGGLGKDDSAVGIAKRTIADEGMPEVLEDVDFGGGLGEFW